MCRTLGRGFHALPCLLVAGWASPVVVPQVGPAVWFPLISSSPTAPRTGVSLAAALVATPCLRGRQPAALAQAGWKQAEGKLKGAQSVPTARINFESEALDLAEVASGDPSGTGSLDTLEARSPPSIQDLRGPVAEMWEQSRSRTDAAVDPVVWWLPQVWHSKSPLNVVALVAFVATSYWWLFTSWSCLELTAKRARRDFEAAASSLDSVELSDGVSSMVEPTRQKLVVAAFAGEVIRNDLINRHGLFGSQPSAARHGFWASRVARRVRKNKSKVKMAEMAQNEQDRVMFPYAQRSGGRPRQSGGGGSRPRTSQAPVPARTLSPPPGGGGVGDEDKAGGSETDLWFKPLSAYRFPEAERRLEQLGNKRQVTIFESVGSATAPGRPSGATFIRASGLIQSHEAYQLAKLAEGSDAYVTEPNVETGDPPTFEYHACVKGEWRDTDIQKVFADILKDKIVPYVRRIYDCPSCAVDTVRVRRYLPGERRTHEAHFSSQAFATVVIPLSRSSAFEGGLYVQTGPTAQSWRFVTMEPGDLLVHSFDLLHGAHVPRGSRYVLIVSLKDSEVAVRDGTAPWLAELFRQGDSHAAYLLGESHELGQHGHPYNVPLAMKFYEKSARLEHICAHTNLGLMYAMLSEDEDNPLKEECREQALELLNVVAKSGFAQAQRSLARMYMSSGQDDDYLLAAYWMYQAAEQLDGEAARYLGLMLVRGSPDGGLSADIEQAKLWLNRSASLGCQISKDALNKIPDFRMRRESPLT